ncbi:MAG: TlpA family protein disulfide reductase [Myxococcales bacterium]|nr:TlpA family protein disulfide reductase [Myxococcales bacterium]
MRSAIVFCSLLLLWGCSPKSAPTEIPNSSQPAPADEAAVDPDDSTAQSEPGESLATEELVPPVDTGVPVPVADAEANIPKKRRYRRGGSKIRKGDRALELRKVVNGAGKRVTLESQKAPILVLTFGASWCSPCKKELPALEKLAKRYSPVDVAFVAVNIDSTIAVGKAFMKRSGLRRVLAVYDPKNGNVQSYDPPTMPSVFIIKEGIVKHLHPGYRSGDERALKKAIDRELN